MAFSQAVESLVSVASQLSSERLDEHFMPLVKKLATGDWFTSRISACGCFAVCYPKAAEASKVELRSYVSNPALILIAFSGRRSSFVRSLVFSACSASFAAMKLRWSAALRPARSGYVGVSCRSRRLRTLTLSSSSCCFFRSRVLESGLCRRAATFDG